MQNLWLRKEDKKDEERVPVTPREVFDLIASGVEVTVERSNSRCFADKDYEAAGAVLTDKSWQSAPLSTVVLGLKELNESATPIAHTHIYFSHTFKGQDGAQHTLSRFFRGGGKIYDLEFLFDNTGKRVAAFGYWAGFVGAALGVLGVAHFIQGNRDQVLPKSFPSFPALRAFADRAALVSAVNIAIANSPFVRNSAPLRIMLMGALGRCGQGAKDLLEKVQFPIEISSWDLKEFNDADKPILEILKNDLFINCVYLKEKIAPMITRSSLARNSRLSVISDVSCDPSSLNNPIPVYDSVTTLESPFIRVKGTSKFPVHVQAIDHLPTLLPRESSEEYSALLFPHLKNFLISDHPTATWVDALTIFEKSMNDCLRSN